ncbi:glycosyltransferase 61 family protein [Paracoccus sp. Z330]|uniref:Glycosyltransferase 61 family protein n=1 Tax=Paracoccus onchidii TaxID=3017813 RepID=A0ABT4ZA76_9RHOB|nr:glycosyltransferase 61 family protein [Paracoccus onchidii]MDB6176256.1 glycosyltransferase 61 family protein [Paracoccus onchidii]
MAQPNLNWISPGLGKQAQLVEEPTWFWAEKDGAIVDAWSVAEDFTHISDQTMSRLNELTRNSARHDGPRKIVEFNCGLIYAPQIQVGNRNFRIDGKTVSIDYSRLLIARELKDKLAAQIEASRAATISHPIDIADGIARDLPVYVQAREIHYFFHFMTETLPQFVTIRDAGLQGPITLCDLNDPPAYVMGFIETLFPELADRVTVSGKRHDVSDALIVADLEDLSRTHGAIEPPRLDADTSAQQQNPHGLLGISTMFSNSHSVNLKRVAETGRDLVAKMDKSHLPKRFVISRRKAKRRKLIGEEKLLELLEPLGFEPFVAEDYSPMEQIAAFSQAEMIVSPHGAGMTNIMFASPNCHAIELTQRQYVGRARHFIRLADIARCGYEIVLCDESGDNYEMKANVGNDVAITTDAAARIARHVQNILQDGFRPNWRLRTDKKVNSVNALTDIAGKEAQRIRFFGMQRSGNHAIINWVARNLGTDSLFLNCCSARKSPYESFTQLEVNGEIIPKAKQVALDGSALSRSLDGTHTLLVSYENHSPTEKNISEISLPTYSGPDFAKNILIHRSYLNWLASYIKLIRSRLQKKKQDSLAEEFAQVARGVSQYTDMLGVLIDGALPENLVAISYDKWCIDGDYRAEVLNRLGLQNQDNSLGNIQDYGGGSSFDETGSAEVDPSRFAKRRDLMEGDLTFDSFAKLLEHDPTLIALNAKGLI